ncbi:helix-turn-helix domain-containing protein [Rickettsia endosymbiont of Urophora cardui]|uniref:helix-turn-helix domain-containing protein n=1 Tax=Rickettsia endosymbiont of Urophora cardui TaxID=3066265 RepID=UPI00313E60A5
MKKNKVKIFSASEKTGIVLELIKEESTLGQLASKYAISVKTIQNWKKQFLGNAAWLCCINKICRARVVIIW